MDVDKQRGCETRTTRSLYKNENHERFDAWCAVLLRHDPVGVLKCLHYGFFITDIFYEYGIEVDALLDALISNKTLLQDVKEFSKYVKKILDHYFYENFEFEKCLTIASDLICASGPVQIKTLDTLQIDLSSVAKGTLIVIDE